MVLSEHGAAVFCYWPYSWLSHVSIAQELCFLIHQMDGRPRTDNLKGLQSPEPLCTVLK